SVDIRERPGNTPSRRSTAVRAARHLPGPVGSEYVRCDRISKESSMSQEATAGEDAGHLARVTDYLRDAVVELEVWRQNARTAEERQALHRVTALLGHAAAELRMNGADRDPAQQALPLPGPGE